MTGNTVTHFHGAYPLASSPNFADVQKSNGIERVEGFDNQAFFTQEKHQEPKNSSPP